MSNKNITVYPGPNARFGRLVLRGKEKRRRREFWICTCDCGTTKSISAYSVYNGKTLSCGCLHREVCAMLKTRHGKSHTKAYEAWHEIKRRCYNPTSACYKYYGARGIVMDERWQRDFVSFLQDMGNPPSEAHSIDRIDTNGPYTASNCRWATRTEQANNTRRNTVWEHNGKKMTGAQWSAETGIGYYTIRQRIRSGWTIKKALETPVKPHK